MRPTSKHSKRRCDPPWEQRYAQDLMVQLRKTPPEQIENISYFPYELWERLRHTGVLDKDLLVGHLPRNSRAARKAREWEWGFYKYLCPPWVPWVIYAMDRQHKGLFEHSKNRRRKGDLFGALVPEERAEAE